MDYKFLYILKALKRAAPKKIWNLLKVQMQKMFFRSSISWGYPIILIFDPSSACNLHCPLCPNGQGRTDRHKTIAQFESFKQIMDEVGDNLFFTEFANWGEPILNRDLAKMVQYAQQKNTETILRTNLTTADKKICDDLVKAGLDEIIISLDGATETTYLKYRRGGNFPKVITNIRYLVEAKRKYRSSIRIIWQYLVSSENEHEIAEAKKMARRFGVTLRLVPLRVDMGQEVIEGRAKQIQKDFKWLPKNEKYSRYDYTKKQSKHLEETCRWLWTRVVINANGSVSPCCAIWEEKFDFGNAYDAGLMAVWNNKKYQKARQLVRTGKPIKEIICSKCLENGFIN